MSDGLLEDIIRMERHLQAECVAEEQRITTWRDGELTRLEAEQRAMRQAADRDDQLALEQARAAAQEEAERLIRGAEDWCERLQALEDAKLQKVLERHLAAILPEGADDHPHGQS